MRRLLISATVVCASVLLPASTALASSSYGSTVMANPNLVGYWRLDERAAQADVEGLTAVDANGAHPGVYHLGVDLGDPGALEGDADTSARFGAPDGYVDIPYSQNINTSTFTVEAWVKLDVAASYMVLAGSGAQAPASGGYSLQTLDDYGKPAIVLQLNHGTTNHLLKGVDYTVGKWYYVVGTYDGTAARLYINGQLTQSVTTAYTPDTSYPLRIGDSPVVGRSGLLKGSVDELAVYNTALNAATVQSHYQLGISGGSGPETILTAAPSGATNQSSATLTFGSPNVDASYQCQLDAGAWVACASPLELAGLAEGAHELQVRAIDRSDRADTTPAVALWTVDTTAPRTAIVGGPPAATASSSAAIPFVAQAGSTFVCQLDGGATAPCISPYVTSGLSDGPHTLTIRATDPAGNVEPTPATFSWSVYSTPPSSFITQAPTSQAPGVPFEFVATVAPAKFRCRVDRGPWESCTSPFRDVPRAAGTHTFRVEAINALGNTDPDDHAYSWTVPAVPAVQLRVTFPKLVLSLATRRRRLRVASTACHHAPACVARKMATLAPRILWHLTEPAALTVTVENRGHPLWRTTVRARQLGGVIVLPDAALRRLRPGRHYTAMFQASENGTISGRLRVAFAVDKTA